MKKLLVLLAIISAIGCQKLMHEVDLASCLEAGNSAFYSHVVNENLICIHGDRLQNIIQTNTTNWEQLAKLSNCLIHETLKCGLIAGVIKPSINHKHVNWIFQVDLEADSIEFSNIECISENKCSITRKRKQ